MRNKQNWYWNGKNKVGPFSLGKKVSAYNDLTKLTRYPEEDYDTYQPKNAKLSKVFATSGVINSIQCGESFINHGVELIGKTVSEVKENFSNYVFNDYEEQFISKCGIIKFFEVEKEVRYIIINQVKRITTG